MTLPPARVVRDHSLLGESVDCDDGLDCGGCVLVNVWYQEIPENRDDSIYEYVNYVGCGSDGDEPQVPEDNDDCPMKPLLSESLCDITEDMTYHEKLEAIYDYDDVNDKRQEYLEYENTNGIVSVGDPMDDDMYYDSDRPDYSYALSTFPDMNTTDRYDTSVTFVVYV